jgi:hypothetical protein
MNDWKNLPPAAVPVRALMTWLQLEQDSSTRPQSPQQFACSLPRWAAVLWWRYCAPEPLTLRELGHKLGVSASRVNQIEAQALRLLRFAVGFRHLITPDDLGPPDTRLRRAVLGNTENVA